MRIQQQDLDYLSGQSYSNGREIKFAFDRIDNQYFSRTEFCVISGAKKTSSMSSLLITTLIAPKKNKQK